LLHHKKCFRGLPFSQTASPRGVDDEGEGRVDDVVADGHRTRHAVPQIVPYSLDDELGRIVPIAISWPHGFR